jgi:Ser/Thr protein kinase RdoA (MazF antagonist)
LEALIKSFHDNGLIHGDLHEPNILCSGGEVMLIDFDGGGKVEEAYYPTAQLCLELTNGRDGDNPKITKADDTRVLGNTLKELQIDARLV